MPKKILTVRGIGYKFVDTK